MDIRLLGSYSHMGCTDVCSVRTERGKREIMFKELLKKCKLVRNCPHCGSANGPVK